MVLETDPVITGKNALLFRAAFQELQTLTDIIQAIRLVVLIFDGNQAIEILSFQLLDERFHRQDARAPYGSTCNERWPIA